MTLFFDVEENTSGIIKDLNVTDGQADVQGPPYFFPLCVLFVYMSLLFFTFFVTFLIMCFHKFFSVT